MSADEMAYLRIQAFDSEFQQFVDTSADLSVAATVQVSRAILAVAERNAKHSTAHTERRKSGAKKRKTAPGGGGKEVVGHDEEQAGEASSHSKEPVRIKKLVPVLRKRSCISPLTAHQRRLVGGVREVLVLDLRKRSWISLNASDGGLNLEWMNGKKTKGYFSLSLLGW